MARVRLRSTPELRRALKAWGKGAEAAVRKAMYKSAVFGKTAVQVEINRARPKPIATQTYKRSFVAVRTRDGAILAPSARHGYFPEAGRRPGRMPPAEPIEEWVRTKKMTRAVTGRKRELSRSPKAMRSKKGRLGQIAALRAVQRLVFMIRRKIARKGTDGRWIVKKTVPVLYKRMVKEIGIAMNKLASRPPRR